MSENEIREEATRRGNGYKREEEGCSREYAMK